MNTINKTIFLRGYFHGMNKSAGNSSRVRGCAIIKNDFLDPSKHKAMAFFKSTHNEVYSNNLSKTSKEILLAG